MQFSITFSKTLKRITPNFNSCLQAFFSKRQKPSNPPTEIAPPISSDSNNIYSTDSDKFTNSANDSIVKLDSPLSNNKLTLHETLGALVKIQNEKYRPVSGAGVFANMITPTDNAGVFSAIIPLKHEAPRQLQRTYAFKQGGRTYQRPRGSKLTSTDPIPQLIMHSADKESSDATQLDNGITNPPQMRTRHYTTENLLKGAYDSSDSDSDVEPVVLEPYSIAKGLRDVATLTTNNLTKNFSALSGALTSGFDSFTTQPTIPSTAAPTTPNTSTAQAPAAPAQITTERQRIVAAAAAARALLKTTSFRNPPMTAQVLDKKPENHTATPVVTIAETQDEKNVNQTTGTRIPNVGRLDPKLLDRFGGGRNTTPSRPASPALNPRADTHPAIPPMTQPQQPISPAQLSQMPSTSSKYPDFKNAEKIKIFNYINQVTDLGYTNIPDDEKPLYFDYSIDMIKQKQRKIIEASNSSLQSAFVKSANLISTKLVLDRNEIIRLFDLINKYLKFNIDDDSKKIEKFTFILKAIYCQKSSIVTGLNSLVSQAKIKQAGVAR